MKLPYLCLGSALLALVSCQREREEIKVYKVAKEPAGAAQPATGADPHAGMPGMLPGGTAGADPHAGIPGMAPGGDPHAGLTAEQLAAVGAPPASRITDTAPAHWKKQATSSMRQASYLIEGEGGNSVDVSLIILGGAAGGNLDNVNRWRGQLGQAPVDEATLKQTAKELTIPAGPAIMVDIEGLAEGADAKKDGRMVGVIASREGDAWFYKMRGNAALTAAEKDNFLTWVQSVKPIAPASIPTHGTPPGVPAAPDATLTPPADPAAPAAPAAPATPPAAAAAPAGGEMTWQVPAGWTLAPASGSRYATFSIAGAGDAKGELAITHFPGDVGGDLANVNRWRGQIGMAPIGEAELAPLVTKLTAGLKTMSLVDLTGPEVRCAAGWTRHGADTWFFKFTGPDALVGAEKAKFTAFLESVRFTKPE
jgi:hypothetical protein